MSRAGARTARDGLTHAGSWGWRGRCIRSAVGATRRDPRSGPFVDSPARQGRAARQPLSDPRSTGPTADIPSVPPTAGRTGEWDTPRTGNARYARRPGCGWQQLRDSAFGASVSGRTSPPARPRRSSDHHDRDAVPPPRSVLKGRHKAVRCRDGRWRGAGAFPADPRHADMRSERAASPRCSTCTP